MLGIYVHIPFCKSKCKYCDFASYPNLIEKQDEYINKIISDLKLLKGRKADTVYIGGGTPSVLSEDNIKRLLFEINNTVELCRDTEFTVEVNPATVSVSKARALKSGGVNRISMGAQSFLDSELKRIGRIHTAEDTKHTFKI